VVQLVLYAPEEVWELAKEDADKRVSELLHQIRVRPEIHLFSSGVKFGYEHPPDKAQYGGYNTVVELNLPYCLHLPNGFTCNTVIRDPGRGALVSIQKTWTELAEGSHETDIVADDRELYYGPFEIASPKLPQAPAVGVTPRFYGKNVEIEKDTVGRFRYSRVRVCFETSHTDLSDREGDDSPFKAAIREASRSALDVVNDVIDVYRFVTGEFHVERLTDAVITLVYFADHNTGFEGAAIKDGLRSAIVNRSAREIDSIATMLSSGQEPERHDLLLLSARSSLHQGSVLIAVILAYQALEILVETKLRNAYRTMGHTDPAISQKLKDHHRLSERLTSLCREVTGSSVAGDTKFWNDWLVKCNRRRNGVVHRNESVTEVEAQELIDLSAECIRRVMALPFPA
jgi:hypothetical protein